jgi:hypothetical protein
MCIWLSRTIEADLLYNFVIRIYFISINFDIRNVMIMYGRN